MNARAFCLRLGLELRFDLAFMNDGFAVVAVVYMACFTNNKILLQTQKDDTFKILTGTNKSINNEKFTMNYTKGNLLAEFLTE